MHVHYMTYMRLKTHGVGWRMVLSSCECMHEVCSTCVVNHACSCICALALQRSIAMSMSVRANRSIKFIVEIPQRQFITNILKSFVLFCLRGVQRTRTLYPPKRIFSLVDSCGHSALQIKWHASNH